jgi:hypothetical protein
MPESENRAPQSVFDAEAEFPHDETRTGRRRRPVADWGGDELFTRMPRRRSGHAVGQRRFARAEGDAAEAQPRAARDREWGDAEGREWSDAPDRDRRGAQDRDWSGAEDRDWTSAEGRDRAGAEGRDWSAAEDRDEWRDSDERRLDVDAEVAELAARESQRTGPEPRRTRPEPAAPTSAPRGGVPGRRTVVIGRPESPNPEAPFVSVSRRRPPRTVAERIGGAPDRIVGWAFALGLILIIVAILTAHA